MVGFLVMNWKNTSMMVVMGGKQELEHTITALESEDLR